MKIILSTHNSGKILQVKAMFTEYPVEVLTLEDAGIEGEGSEDGSTLEENAMSKALFAHQPGAWSMADDTGLYIDALDGRPGIHAARWAGKVSIEEIAQYTLKQLDGVTDRGALFKTVVAVVSPDGEQKFFSGEVRGTILEAPRVPPQPNMPYSPIFVPEGSTKVWAEMSTDEENAISHRGKAFRLTREYLMESMK